MEIYYFSGTGNSLHTARELAARFPEATLIPIMSVLEKDEIKTQADVIGLIFPIHAFTIPWPVQRFLEKANFNSATYIFAVATRICFELVFRNVDKLLEKQGKQLSAYFCFEMPQNYIPVFNVYPPEECARVEKEMQAHLKVNQKNIANREIHRPEDPPVWSTISRLVYPLLTAFFQKVRFPVMEKSYYADRNCSGCGICERVCPTNKIKMENGKPVWEEDTKCAYCFACLHYCPEQAIQIRRRKTASRGRYHHPTITVKDIAEQKR